MMNRRSLARFYRNLRGSTKYTAGVRYISRGYWASGVLFGFVILASLASASAGIYALHGAKQTSVKRSNTSHSAKSFGLAVGDELPWMSNKQLNNELSGMAGLGVGWIRIDVSWADVQPNKATQYDWSNLDRVVKAAHKHHLNVLGTLAYTPEWARPIDCLSSQQCAPANNQQFASFAHAAATRYAHNGISAWEVWNEPNNEGFWQPAPSPKSYAQLLKVTYRAIKRASPHATVLLGGLGPLDGSTKSLQQQTFLSGVYAAGGKPYFNAVGYHPYSFPALPSDVASWSGWSTMAALPTSIRSIMTAHKDGAKKIWITEYGAPTGGPGALATPLNLNFGQHADHVSSTLQTEMLTQAVSQYKADGWLGNFFWYEYQDEGTAQSSNENFFGLLTQNGIKKPAYYAYHAAIKGKDKRKPAR